MILKKINAVLAILSVITLFFHISYCAYAYFAMYYNEALKFWTAIPFMVLTCLHAVFGMCTVFLQGDGTRLDVYPGWNKRTILQRVSAALIFPLLILHLNTFNLLASCAGGGRWFFFVLIVLSQPLFYGVVLAHTAVSFSRALITLGWLSSTEKKKITDRIVYAVCIICFVLSAFFIIKGQLAMFLH